MDSIALVIEGDCVMEQTLRGYRFNKRCIAVVVPQEVAGDAAAIHDLLTFEMAGERAFDGARALLRADKRADGVFRCLSEAMIRGADEVRKPGGNKHVADWWARRRPRLYAIHEEVDLGALTGVKK